MKHSEHLTLANLLAWLVPVALTLPNVYICMLGSMKGAECAALLLPLGGYMLLATASTNTPRTTVMLFPVMFIGAFQIVVSYLYHDGSPIGVDMFLNVWTTNLTEVDELLSSLVLPVALVVVLYLPLTVAAAVAWRRHRRAAPDVVRLWRRVGLAAGGAGVAACAWCLVALPTYRVSTRLFPVNALYNLKEAVERQYRMAHYSSLSAHFSYHARDTHGKGRELYIAVVGETSRADNWQLMGYGRRTNPLLTDYGDSIVAFGRAFSESNTTHKSVPMLLNTLASEHYDEGLYSHKSIITAFREAGFHTTFLSVQRPNRSMIEWYAHEAQTVRYVEGRLGMPALDGSIVPLVDAAMADRRHDKQLIVVHLYGSHYDYADRYPAQYAVFRPDHHRQANAESRPALLNAYDNTIVYTDHVLAELIGRLRAVDYNAALIYSSDHGEDIFDDARNKFLHASPVPTYWQLHVPLLVYMNPAYAAAYPALRANALRNRPKRVSTSKSYAQTLLHLAGIDTRYSNDTLSLLSPLLRPQTKLKYLTDLDESVDLDEWGFSNYDKEQLKIMNGYEQQETHHYPRTGMPGRGHAPRSGPNH